MKRLGIAILLTALVGAATASGQEQAGEPAPVRVGVLEFGTVYWELDTIRHHGFDSAHGIDLRPLALAGREATTLALRSGDVDVIVIDWIWVSRERASGADYTFIPFSNAVGALVASPEAGVDTLADLAGKTVGIAGGPLDKSWLMLRALSEHEDGIDLEAGVEEVFGAPPLLNEQLRLGRLDAVVTYWHFVPELEAEGMTAVLDVAEAATRLGLGADVPLLGFVFSESWAENNPEAARGLLRASLDAKRLLAQNDGAWERLRPLMQAPDDEIFVGLREGYRAGIPPRWSERERETARRVFAIMAELGGEDLVGPSDSLEPGTFWAPADF